MATHEFMHSAFSLPRRQLVRGTCASIGLATLGWPAARVASAAGTDSDLAEFRKAKVDWRAYKGRTVVLGAIEHPWTEAIVPQIPLFEQLTGINVRVLKQSEAAHVAAMPGRMAAKSPTPDVLMVYNLGGFIADGWLAPLEPLYGSSDLFDAAWFDANDIFPAAREIPRWRDKTSYSQSITMEAQTLFANQAVLTKAGQQIPKTFDELRRVAVAAKGPDRAGISIRCKPEGGTMWVTAGFIFSNGGSIIDTGGNCAFDADPAVEAVEYVVKLLRDAGPAHINHDWYEALRDFGNGAAALGTDSSSFATTLSNTAKTPIAADVVYAPFPGNGKRPAEPNVWAWQVGINAFSTNKEAAFLFMCFMNSPPGCMLSAANGQATPRPSAWKSEAFMRKFGRNAAQAAIANAQAGTTTKFKATWQHPKSTQVLDALARAVYQSVSTGSDVRTGMREQASTVRKLLEKR